jgi:hypothetical protein
MKARQGRDTIGGSLRSTTARPRLWGNAHQSHGDEVVQIQMLVHTNHDQLHLKLKDQQNPHSKSIKNQTLNQGTDRFNEHILNVTRVEKPETHQAQALKQTKELTELMCK